MKNQSDQKDFSTISVIGLGYIGLPTAAILASKKIQVIGVDIKCDVVDLINQGKIHIIEPDLDNIVHSVVSEGYLFATTKPVPSDVFLIAVPTPVRENNVPDLAYIHSAVKAISSVIKKDDLIILESTSPVGTTEKMAEWLAALRPDLTFPQLRGDQSDVRLAYCPERVLPGQVLRELIHNDRVIGGMTEACIARATQFYKLFVEGECYPAQVRTAEMCKLTENSFRDVNIAFANELSMICDKLGIDVNELISLANHHPRVNIMRPGPGVGGHCIAIDPWFIVHSSPSEANLIRMARNVNDNKPVWVIEKIRGKIRNYLENVKDKSEKDMTISFLGITFKENIDDVRESPSLKIVLSIAQTVKARILIVEPNISSLPKGFPMNVDLVTLNYAKKASDLIVKLVKHREFSQISHQTFHEKQGYIDFTHAMTS